MKTDLLKFMKTLNIEDLPKEFKNRETEKIYNISLCVARELLRGTCNKAEIKEIYDVDDYIIELIINQIYSKSFEAGEYVDNKLREQRKLTKAEDVSYIVEQIFKCGNKKNMKLNNEQRVRFAYEMYKLNLVDTFKDLVMDKIYSKLPEDSAEFEIVAFANKEFGFRRKNFMDFKYGHNKFEDFDWLDTFNIEHYFGIRNGKQNNRYKFNVDGKVVELSVERAIEIMKILSDNNIPLVDCIVRAALKMDVYGRLEQFINSLIWNDEKVKTRVR